MRTFPVLTLGVLLSVGTTPDATPQEPAPEPTPLDWPELVELTMTHNVAIRQAEEQQKEALGRQVVAVSRAAPQLSATGLTLPPTLIIELDQRLYDRALLPEIRRARVGVVTAATNFRLVVETELLKVYGAALAREFAAEVVRATEAYEKILTDGAERAEARFGVGRVQRSDVESILVRRTLLNAQIEAFRGELREADLELAQAVGLSADDPAWQRPRQSLGRLPSDTLPPMEKLVQSGQENRLDLALLEQIRKTNEYQVQISTAPIYPRLDFLSRVRFTGGVPDELGDVANQLDEDDEEIKSRFRFGGQLSWRLYDGGATLGLKEQAQADLKSAEVALAELREDARIQVVEAVRQLEAQRRIATTLESVEELDEMVQMAEDSWFREEIATREWLQFQGELYRRRIDRARVILESTVAKTALRRATGQFILWSESGPSLP